MRSELPKKRLCSDKTISSLLNQNDGNRFFVDGPSAYTSPFFKNLMIFLVETSRWNQRIEALSITNKYKQPKPNSGPLLYVLDHIPLKRDIPGEKSGNVSHQNQSTAKGTEVHGFLGMDPFHGNISWQLSRLSGF